MAETEEPAGAESQHLRLLRRARELRTASTDAERLLWAQLRAGRFESLKFRRQQPLKGYVVDFYCHAARLVIELDGGGHAQPAEATYDVHRTAALERDGVRVLRFWNHEVMADLDVVLEVTRATARERLGESRLDEPTRR